LLGTFSGVGGLCEGLNAELVSLFFLGFRRSVEVVLTIEAEFWEIFYKLLLECVRQFIDADVVVAGVELLLLLVVAFKVAGLDGQLLLDELLRRLPFSLLGLLLGRRRHLPRFSAGLLLPLAVFRVVAVHRLIYLRSLQVVRCLRSNICVLLLRSSRLVRYLTY